MNISDLPAITDKMNQKPGLHTRVVQFGEGNFLRAFVDWIIHRMNEQLDFNTAVTVIQPIEKGLIDMLNGQDGLYTLFLQGMKEGKSVEEHEVIRCIREAINPYTDFDRFIKLAEDPDMRFIISNTTEAGITFDARDKPGDEPPSSFPAKVTAFLYHRYQTFSGDADKGCIVIPCELIDRNGDHLKKHILEYAGLWNLEEPFTTWINASNIFCNTLVDRIVPGYPKDRIESIWKDLGYRDQLVVEGEYFHLWVIEGPARVREEFPADRAGLNVIFTDEMAPYRTRKVRILNGAHTTMTLIGLVAGIETVQEAVEHDVMGPFIERTVYDEIVPTMEKEMPDVGNYAGEILERFHNPYIKHYLSSISLNSVSKYGTRILPTLLDSLEHTGKLPHGLALALAALLRLYKGQLRAQKVDLKDDPTTIASIQEAWSAYSRGSVNLKKMVSSILSNTDLWGKDLDIVPGLTEKTATYLERINVDDPTVELMNLLRQ